MKTQFFGILTGLAITFELISTSAQTAPISRPAATATSAPNSPTFTNSSGQSFTVDQLAAQLRNLRAAVDQTLPLLTAFNQSATATASSQGLAGRLEGLVSGALSRNGVSSPTVTNLLTSLRGMLGTTNATTASTDAKTAQDLATLQNDLQPLPSLLQSMNVGGGSSSAMPSPSQVISASPNAGYNATNARGTAPTPTGRPY